MNWHQFVEWTDTTAKPEGDCWESLRAGLIEKCHEALAIYHQIKSVEFGAVKRLHRDGPPDARRLEARQTKLDRLRRKLVKECGDACWYAARICRVYQCEDVPVIPIGMEVDPTEEYMRFLVVRLSRPWGKSEAWKAVGTIYALMMSVGVTLAEAIADNEAKLLARKAAGTIGGEGER